MLADLQRVDRAIRPGVSHRAKLKSGSAEAWNDCHSSLQKASQIIEDSSFSDQNSSAAVWIHWRKSGTSKQLLGLLRTAVEEAPGSALVAGCVRECALHVGLRIIGFLFKRSQYGALWPAMREWIVDQGGLQAVWQALAWSMALVGGDQAAHDAALREPVHAVIGLMSRRSDGTQPTFPTSSYPSTTAALTLLFSDIWPRDLASKNAHQWAVRELLSNITNICKQACHSEPQPQLHRAFLVAWPHLMRWIRKQASDVKILIVRH